MIAIKLTARIELEVLETPQVPVSAKVQNLAASAQAAEASVVAHLVAVLFLQEAAVHLQAALAPQVSEAVRAVQVPTATLLGQEAVTASLAVQLVVSVQVPAVVFEVQ